MTKTENKILKCISPIDGSIFAERETLSSEQAKQITVNARTAQSTWAKRPLQERIDLVNAAVLKLGESQEETTIELAHQMGRPVKHGGEYSGFRFRAETMADLAEKALAPIIVEDSERPKIKS